MFEFHVSRLSRDKYDFAQSLFAFDGNVIFANFLGAREFAQKINNKRDLVNYPEDAVTAGDINALGLIDEILHLVISLYRKEIDAKTSQKAYLELVSKLGEEALEKALVRFVEDFPPLSVYRGGINPKAYLQASTNNTPNKYLIIEELLLLWITNKNPATSPFTELFDDSLLSETTAYRNIIEQLNKYFGEQPSFGPDNQDLVTMLRSPAVAEPNSLAGQLEFIRRKWGFLLGEYLYRLLSSIDLIKEEESKMFFVGGSSPTQITSYEFFEEGENFSPDSDWMPKTVMMAKNSHVWLYQLSETYQREIQRLDQIPDEELDKLAQWGFNGLWLIGLWERSEASKTIKQLCGNPEAVASAYSLKNYEIASDLGGETAYQNLRDRAWKRGIRLASDMVPNHMGIDSEWVINHPGWFVSLPHSPFPAYTFNGPDLSPVEHIGIFLDDHYYDRTDAAVVFLRIDRQSGDARYIYHGNDGTRMPWNDTAQLDYLNAEVREAVVQTILHVARKFPIIRFDAAMTLAKKHYQRLWFPQPGTGGAIPSRAEYGLTKEAFDQVFPKEFWREVVDRVAEEVPNTLLLAEAFWLMEGYFVRTLGMHRVYNSAFMNMLRNEENSKYRLVIKNTLEFDPEILKRYVNFMNNPDEKTAVDQFGKGDKYFGICTLMSTMPGLPMFGHGQIEGFAEKYGMEYYRPYWDEQSDSYLIERHRREIFPLLKQRGLFSGIDNFLLFDFYTGDNLVNEDVFAYTNGNEYERSLVIYLNRFDSTQGWIHSSASFLNKNTGNLENRKLHEALKLSGNPKLFVIFRDNATQLEYIRSSEEIIHRGLYFELNAYECHVFMDFREVSDNISGQYSQLNNYLAGRGVPSIAQALHELMMAPILTPVRNLINQNQMERLFKTVLWDDDSKLDLGVVSEHRDKFSKLMHEINSYINGSVDVSTITNESIQGIDAILKIPVFESHFPFPGSKHYADILTFIKKDLDHDPLRWFLLFLWNDLRLLGKAITTETQFAEISRSWLSEWGILRILSDELKASGFNHEQVSRSETILKLLVGQQNWIESIDDLSEKTLVESWITNEEIRFFINVNRYRDTLWFNKEAFEELVWWMMVIGLIKLKADPDKSLTETIERLLLAYEKVKNILVAEKVSEYQVEKLLEGLK